MTCRLSVTPAPMSRAFRGAACEGGRTGHVSREKVSALRNLISPSHHFAHHR